MSAYLFIGCVIGVAVLLVTMIFLLKIRADRQKTKRKAARKQAKERQRQQAIEADRKRPAKVIISEQVPTKIKRGRPSVILLVEDSPTIMLELRKVLERWNYKVITAVNGRHAWAELQKTKPDLVISDIDMPELSGIELVKLAREDLLLMDLPVILITGNPQYDLELGQRMGVEGMLLKPFSDKALIDQVRYILQE